MTRDPWPRLRVALLIGDGMADETQDETQDETIERVRGLFARYNRLIAMRDFMIALEGCSPEEHRRIWNMVWAIYDMKKELH